ncbi:MAG: 50S ribosomal protein L10 [Nitrospirae bacterium]|nr:50S ribosomal protein L10 [Candidatus Manganitrophaceae bacterium]
MNREEKKASVSQLNDKFSRASVAILAEFSGMGVEELRQVRKELRAAGAELQVVKNKLAIRASVGTTAESLGVHFKGSTVVAFGYADPVAPTKALKAAADKQKKLKVKAGVIEGTVVDLEDFKKIALLPSKDVLIAELIGRFNGPITGFAGSLNGILSKFVRALDAVQQQREDS